MIELYVAGVVGGFIPNLVRLLHYGTIRRHKRFRVLAVVIPAAAQIILGVLSVWLLEPTTLLQAAAFGYAAPEVLVRILAALATAASPPPLPPHVRSATLGGGPHSTNGLRAQIWAWIQL